MATLEVTGVQAVGIDPSSIDEEMDEVPALCSTLGFAGKLMRGAVALVSPVALLRTLHPFGLSGVSEEDLRDQMSELTNQFVGRMKTKLLPHGISMVTGVPHCFAGHSLRSLPDEANTTGELLFRISGSVLCVHFAAAIDPSIDFTRPPVAQKGSLAEGEVLVF